MRLFLLALVLSVVVGHLAGGWYFADQIESQGLAVSPWHWPMEDELVAINGTELTIRDLGAPTRELRSQGTYELIWAGGQAIIEGTPVVHGNDVDRRLVEDTGPSQGLDSAGVPTSPARLPPIGTKVGVSSFVAPYDLVRRSEVSYTSPLGPMTADIDYAVSNATWAILVHGKGADASEQLRLMDSFQRAGITAMAIRYRNDAGMPSDPSHEYGYGATEWADLAAAVDYARSKGASRVILGGTSMGGAIVASYLRHAHPTDVAAVVLDSPLLDFRSTVEWTAEQMSPPPPPTVTWVAERLAGWRYDVDWDALDYATDPAWATMPILVIHGDADSTVPLATSQVLAHRRGNVRLVTVKGAEHVEAWNTDPTAYDAAVTTFLHDTHLAAW